MSQGGFERIVYRHEADLTKKKGSRNYPAPAPSQNNDGRTWRFLVLKKC